MYIKDKLILLLGILHILHAYVFNSDGYNAIMLFGILFSIEGYSLSLVHGGQG